MALWRACGIRVFRRNPQHGRKDENATPHMPSGMQPSGYNGTDINK